MPSGMPLSDATVLLPENVIVDASDLGTLGLSELPSDVEINSHRRRVDDSYPALDFFGKPLRVWWPCRYPELSRPWRRYGDVLIAASRRRPKYPCYSICASQARSGIGCPRQTAIFEPRELYWTTQTGAGGALINGGSAELRRWRPDRFANRIRYNRGEHRRIRHIEGSGSFAILHRARRGNSGTDQRRDGVCRRIAS